MILATTGNPQCPLCGESMIWNNLRQVPGLEKRWANWELYCASGICTIDNSTQLTIEGLTQADCVRIVEKYNNV